MAQEIQTDGNPRRVVVETRGEVLTLPPREFERRAPMQGDEGRRLERVEILRNEDSAPNDEDRPATIGEVQAVINSLVQSIISNFVTKPEMSGFQSSLNSFTRNFSANFVTRQQAERIAREAVPPMMRDLEKEAKRTGNIMMLSPGGEDHRDSLYFGSAALGGGLSLGEKVFFGYKINPDNDTSTTKVRIYSGEIDRFEVDETDITVVNDDFAYVKRTIAADTFEILAGATVPDDSVLYSYFKLYQFSVVTSGDPPVSVTTIKKYCRPFGIESSLSIKGIKVLYKGAFLREYDENGDLVAVGDEFDPSDYADQETYENALENAGHTLRLTYDWMRSGQP